MAEGETISWFAGVDWGSERHQVCLLDARGTTVGERAFSHSGEGLAELGDWLLSMASAASTVAVAIEVPHGPVVGPLQVESFKSPADTPQFPECCGNPQLLCRRTRSSNPSPSDVEFSNGDGVEADLIRLLATRQRLLAPLRRGCIESNR